MINKVFVPALLPTLQSKRLILRPMEDNDAAALFEIYGDPLVMKYTDEAPFPDQDTVALMLKSVRTLLAEGLSLEWAIVTRDGGEVVGTCGLHSFDTILRVAEAGCLLRRSDWGKGLMAEAIGVVMHFAKDVMQLHRLIADVDPDNKQAQRLFQKLGYKREHSGMLEIDLNDQHFAQFYP
jgi:RimJ/RimL family protein N-acetyltransferase